MTLEELLNHHDLKVVILEQRYGGGFFAGIEIEDHTVIETVNDLNGETEWEFYGIGYGINNPWYPVAWGETAIAALEALRQYAETLTKDDERIVYTALNVLRKLKAVPDYGVQVLPKTLVDLREWFDRWNNGEDDTKLLVQK
ncbi:hypothetical protein D3C81_727280 [compost metagenome]